MTYQGWKNYETWNVSLWVNNDEPMYREMRALRPFTPQKAELMCKRFFPNGTPDMETDNEGDTLSVFGRRERMNMVDWKEIADEFNAE